MALSATPYKVELNLTDLDRDIYETLRFTMARHPSETEERLAARLLALVLWYDESLVFGRGLSNVDEAALWQKSLDGRVLHWVEVGQPDSDRLVWCSRRAERVSLLVYGDRRMWETKVFPALGTLDNVNVVALPAQELSELSRELPRSIDWAVMISEDSVFVTDAEGQHELALTWLKGDR
ncbi:hypothetical protein GCM10007160_14820 [Litchfieldella qijiaojingensis]|uniref:YaeQ family protein n=1 Tax=Litchfieldella qijiaojingensis TaxID=980347 RepID=A0ABQ2YLM9_9GAMM|nr:YaeQ family protein [Halomonas qijiaojingensis]GGX88389.1 hypothetical protein GCM10007160_14820 [Halomonas qijiaojingensis]